MRACRPPGIAVHGRIALKLYYHPVSTTSRPVMLFASEAGIALDLQVVDLFTGEQYGPAYSAINPSH